ncbi:ATP-binding protein [Rhodospirillum rubrum]|uniref:histidine kinase n=1 Tax=Rhodospirillum rubrum (strain ATCC 11170 / ATH 1.1.1 / DSM 467 / LMG 4362 / NCIMB 8255 / S1) TaxID=269796 RepID=Q2RQS3_RHORT|nr:ATP-binding protein [Rhodospirillum rubrum]ABC23522.1 multi-sensor hybrid histidine kinase [Rhodospirillum rubrum ATCC 11170]AEO49261.1 multi-sensor hybrid histidine kinase [Rhodospirillum rubrum F11]MBK5955195.1 hybrid sensor histidine kinase/response regulator [Rhodospirillum rubrum]QXG79489.1 PAS domain-containing protein [Rhodospirillum rubrum]
MPTVDPERLKGDTLDLASIGRDFVIGLSLMVVVMLALAIPTILDRPLPDAVVLAILIPGLALVLLLIRRQRTLFKAIDRSGRRLADSEARIRDFAQSSSDWFWETGPTLAYTYASPRLLDLSGNDPAKIMGQRLSDLCPDPRSDAAERIATRRPFRDLALTVDLGDGYRRHFRLAGRPVLDDRGVFAGYRGAGVDVTGEIAASARSEALRDLMFDAVDSISEGFVLFDPEGRLVVVNDSYRYAYPQLADHLVPGITFEELLKVAARGRDLGAEKDLRGWIDERLHRHREGGTNDCKLSDGRWYRIGEHETRGGGLVKVLMDITEMKTGADRLAQQTALLRTFVDETPVAVAMVDATLRYLRVSRRWRTEFGLEDRDIIGQRHDVVMPSLPDDWLNDYEQALSGVAIEREEVSIDLGGRTLWLRRREYPWFLEDGTVGGLMMTAENITERKQAELALLQSQKMEAVGQLAGGIAHEFNNMLTSIGGFARMAQRTPERLERVTMCLAEVVRSADRAAGLTSQLLNFSRRTTEEETLRIPLGALLDELRTFLKPVLGERIALDLRCAVESLFVLANRDRLHQALVNLCINARDAMAEGGTVIIETGHGVPPERLRCRHPHLGAGQHAVLRVIDSGCGIPEEDLPRVFEPFFTTKAQGKGTGLGLPMVYAMAEQANGAVELDSIVGRGTTVTLYLPLADGAAAAPTIEGPPPLPRGGARILLVEDEDAVRRFAAMVLEDGGYAVRAATNGREALDIWEAEGGRFDLLISDLVMPELGGLALYDRLRAHTPLLPAVLMSGYSDEIPSEDAREGEGARRVLAKPVTPDALIAAVEELLTP